MVLARRWQMGDVYLRIVNQFRGFDLQNAKGKPDELCWATMRTESRREPAYGTREKERNAREIDEMGAHRQHPLEPQQWLVWRQTVPGHCSAST